MRGKLVAAGAAVICAAGLLMAMPGPAEAQNKELSDKTVTLLMQYAWQLTPQKYVTPDGKTILVDKNKREAVVVPVDNAREIIRVARMSAHAQICDLTQEQQANFQTLMRREQAKATWSEQQMLYINQLHLFTVMTLTGSVKASEDGKDLPAVKGELGRSPPPCSDADKKKIQDQIMAYVSAAPPAAGKAK